MLKYPYPIVENVLDTLLPYYTFNRESVANSVVQATGTVEFDDDLRKLRMGILPGGCWYLPLWRTHLECVRSSKQNKTNLQYIVHTFREPC